MKIVSHVEVTALDVITAMQAHIGAELNSTATVLVDTHTVVNDDGTSQDAFIIMVSDVVAMGVKKKATAAITSTRKRRTKQEIADAVKAATITNKEEEVKEEPITTTEPTYVKPVVVEQEEEDEVPAVVNPYENEGNDTDSDFM